MSELADDGIVTDALLAFIESIPNPAGGFYRCGDADAPADSLTPPHFELRQLPDGENPSGGWAQPLAVMGFKFQLLCVGLTRRQAHFLAGKARERFFEAAAGHQSGYLHPITIPKHEVVHRELVSNLGFVPNGRAGGHLLHVRIRVHRVSA